MAAGMKRARTSSGGYSLMRRGPKAIARLARRGVIPRGVAANIHSFKRCGEPLYITNGATAGSVNTAGNTSLIGPSGLASGVDFMLNGHTRVRGALQFSLSQLSNVGEITNLFDNYRIKKVKLSFLFSFDGSNPSVPGAQGTLQCPVMHYCYDPDDATTPANLTTVLQNSYARTVRLTRPLDVWITPRAQNSIVGGVGGAGGLMPQSQWLDSDSTGIVFHGLKFILDQFPAGSGPNQMGVTITPTYYIEAKNVM